MDLYAFYEGLGVDYNAALQRLGGHEVLVKKYLASFVRDNDFAGLKAAVEALDYPEILRTAHSLKGISLNLELTPLAVPCCELVSAIRAERYELVDELFRQIESSWRQILEGMEAVRSELK